MSYIFEDFDSGKTCSEYNFWIGHLWALGTLSMNPFKLVLQLLDQLYSWPSNHLYLPCLLPVVCYGPGTTHRQHGVCHSEDKKTGWIQIPLNTSGFSRAFVIIRFRLSAVKLAKGERLERRGYFLPDEKVCSYPCPLQKRLVHYISTWRHELASYTQTLSSCFHRSVVPVKCTLVLQVQPQLPLEMNGVMCY